MVLKITELRQKYGVYPSFETEEEALAYQQEREEAYEERINKKIEELKALYNSDKDKYSKFKNFTEKDWREYAEICLENATYKTLKCGYAGFPSLSNDPEVAKWAGFSYEEILQMESNGVLIPKEVLAWAHSMQDSDVTAYEINDSSEEDELTDGDNSGNTELKEMQKKTQSLSNKSENTQVQINQNFEQFKETAKKAEQIRQEQENNKKNSLKQIEELTNEWEELVTKVKKGGELTDAEKKRYKELGTMLNGKDGELITDVQASTDELQELMNSMDGLNTDITEGIELGDNTVDMAKQLALYEKGYKNVFTDKTIDITIGNIRNLLAGAEGQSIAKEALDNGSNLIEFSNTLNNQLMMNQYASLYDFAEIFTQSSNETIENTKQVMGDDFNKSSEEFEEEGQVTEEEDSEELSMDGLTTMGLGTKKLTAKVNEIGAKSEKLNNDAIKEIKKINKEAADLANEKQAIIEKQQNEQVVEQEDTANEEPEKTEENITPAENTEEDNNENFEINNKIEANNDKGLKVKEKLQKSLNTNKNYDKFNTSADNIMDATCNMGAVATTYGTVLIGNGSSLIAAGVPLLSNMFTYAAGVALIVQGTCILTAGVGFTGLGADLIAIGVEGIEATDITGTQIDITDENIQEALKLVTGQDGVEDEEELSAAEAERQELIKNGTSLPDQARHFKDKSNQETEKSLAGIMETAKVKTESEKETKLAETTAQSIERKMKAKKAEYDKLAEKKEKADKQEEDVKNALKNPTTFNGKIEESDEEFTADDQAKMDKLGNQLKQTGDKGQKKLFQALTKIEGLDEFLADKEEIALTTIDYGQVTQIVGQELIDASKGNLFLIFRMLLGLKTRNAGETADVMGNNLNEFAAATIDLNNTNKSTVRDAQATVQEVTMSEAISTSANSEDENSEETDSKEEENSKADSPMGDDTTRAVEKDFNSAKSNTDSDTDSYPEKASAGDVNNIKNIGSEVKKGAEESKGFASDAKRDEKQIEKEQRNTVKLLNQDEKKIKKIIKETEAALVEQEALMQEFEELQAQNEEISARQQQNNQPQMARNNQQEAQGGVLAPQSNGLMGGNEAAQDTAVLEANQNRMGAISNRFKVLTKTTQNNRTTVTKLNSSAKKRRKKIEKLTKEKDRIIQKRIKTEEAKQQKFSKQMAVIGVFNNIFSITMSIGAILVCWPPTVPAGNMLIYIGASGMMQCAIVKASILAANGMLDQAFMCLGQAIITCAAAVIPAAGAAASVAEQAGTAMAAIQTASASLQTVSSTAEMVGNIQVAKGEEAAGWTQTLTSVAGAAGALTGVAGSISGGLSGSLFNKITQVTGMSGAVISTSAQITSMIDGQSKATNLLAMIGAGMSTAASASNLLGSATGWNNDKATRTENRLERLNAKNAKNPGSVSSEKLKAASDSAATAKAEAQAKAQQQELKAAEKEQKKVEKEVKRSERDQADNAEQAKIAQAAQAPVVSDEMRADIDNQLLAEPELKTIDLQAQEINNSQTADEIQNFNPQEQPEIAKQEGIISDEMRTDIDNELGSKSIAEQQKELSPQNDIEPEHIANNAEKRVKRNEKMDKIQEILGKVGETASGGSQVVQALGNLKTEEPAKENKSNVKLYDMRKGKELIKKVKRRTAILASYRRSR